MIPSFSEERLELGYDYGATGGPEFNVEVTEVSSGHENRNILWAGRSRGSWDVGGRNVIKTQLEYLRDFFRSHRGKGVGFRIKDWSDHEVSGTLILSPGQTTLQIIKKYTSGSVINSRDIKKPVANSFTFLIDSVECTSCMLDITTGIVTLPAAATGGEEFKYSGEFDTPVRFDSNKFTAEFLATDDNESVFFVSALPIIEIMI